jgi:hypothetical protein
MYVDEFQLDPDVRDTLKAIRESMRQLFEELRLRNESGDVSGKERLERVPALAKRNFRNLAGGPSHLAAKEAWRLVDFLEGNSEARLSPRAREALRVVELDKKLAAFRASERWTQAALRLREALGASCSGRGDPEGPDWESLDGDKPPLAPANSQPASEFLGNNSCDADAEGAAGSASVTGPRRKWLFGLVALCVLSAVALPVMLSGGGNRLDPRACLKLESASERQLAAHWTVPHFDPLPLPPPDPSRPEPLVFTISDPADGGAVRSIWTTSRFSYAQEASGREEGGGQADVRLRVGGWGDTYLSLLKFPLPDNGLVRRAVVRLTVLGDEPSSRPTAMALRTVESPWEVAAGPENRLWWRDCPLSRLVGRHLPPPGPPETVYDIDITTIYNHWARGFVHNDGILLEPEQIGSHSAGGGYPNFSTFYSTRAIDPEKRPKLILTY